MKNAIGILAIATLLVLSGCASYTTKTYDDGEVAPVQYWSGDMAKKNRDIHYASEKLSANLYDYQQAYVLAYLEAREQGIFAPDKPRLPLFGQGADTVALGTLGIALNIAGSSWASGLFSPSFLTGWFLVGLINPNREEEFFVSAAKGAWNNLYNSEIT